MKENSMNKEETEKLKNLKAVYSGAIQSGEIGIANMIKGGIDLIEKLQKENEELKNIELKSKGGAIKISLEGVLSLENKIKQLEKEKKKLELEIKNRKFSHMNLYNEYKYYKQFKSLSIETIKNKIEYLDKQQADWIEDRELKVSDSEIIFARDTLEKLLEDNYEKF